jgi:hypothetical protein
MNKEIKLTKGEVKSFENINQRKFDCYLEMTSISTELCRQITAIVSKTNKMGIQFLGMQCNFAIFEDRFEIKLTPQEGVIITKIVGND